MNFISTAGYLVYALSTIAAAVSGCIPLILFAASEANSAPSASTSYVFYFAATLLLLCYGAPLVLLASRAAFPSLMATIGSTLTSAFCGYAVIESLRHWLKAPPPPGLMTGPPPWALFAIPLIFNLIQAGLSFSKFNQLRTPR
jgi:hypothetical protein